MIDLNKARILDVGNRILVRLTQDNRKQVTESGIVSIWRGDKNLYDDLDRFTEEVRFANRFGEVVLLPSNTELKIGDLVWFNFAQMAEGLFFTKDDSIYVFVDYDECYAAKRGDERLTLNGYVLLSKIPYMKISELESERADNLDIGKVKHVDGGDFLDLKEGDVVFFTHKDKFQELEHEFFACYDGNEVFLVGKKEDVGLVI